MRYFKRYWNENAGGLCCGWGGATYFFETDETGNVTRQIQVFDNGNCLLNDSEHLEDGYGGLSEKPIDLKEFEAFEITASEFEQWWLPGAALNWRE